MALHGYRALEDSAEMNRDLVVGIDSSTSATKAIAWDRHGSPIAQGRSPIPLASPAPDWYEQNPEDWWRATSAALLKLAQKVNPARVAAVAISNQRETFVPLDRMAPPSAGHRLAGSALWRGGSLADQRVGKHDPSDLRKAARYAPVAYRIAWMLRNEPECFGRPRCSLTCTATSCGGSPARSGRVRASADPWASSTWRRRSGRQEVLAALELRRRTTAGAGRSDERNRCGQRGGGGRHRIARALR